MTETEPIEDEAIKKLPPEVQLQAEAELGETARVMRDSVVRLRQLINEEPLLHCPTDRDFLVKFLRCRKYSVEAAMQTIRRYFRMRHDNPDIFGGLVPGRVNFEAVFGDNHLITVLGDKDPLGRCISMVKLGAWNSNICPLNDFVRAALLIGEHVLRDPQIQVTGVVAVVDTKGVYLHHVRHYTPLFIKRLIHIVQVQFMMALDSRKPSTLSTKLADVPTLLSKVECYPLRVKGVYIVNNPPLFELLYAVARPFLKTKIVERIHFIGDDYDKLHAFIPPELLPREYGGIHEPYDCDGLEKELRRSSRYFEEINQSGYQTK